MPDAVPLPSHVRFPDGPAGRACPACGADDTRGVYEVDGIPAHSCVLLDDPDAARAFPTGDMRLAHCLECGFLFNAAFDVAKLDYSEDYEETQGCSSTFERWLGELARDLDRRLSLAESTVVEIGCGRGDFLALLCQTTGSRGVGVDPSGTAGRVDLGSGRGLEFLRAEYGPEHALLEPELVVCRHTLEHIAPVLAFVEQVRTNLGEREAALFLEVPDVVRVLREGAFWDVYYEHSSYFSTGSLARLVRRAGFELDEVWTSYADQYIQLLARSHRRSERKGATPDDGDEVARAVTEFRATCSASLAHWHTLLEQISSAGQSAVIWGSGSKGTGFLTTLGAGDLVSCVVDINPSKHGRFVAGTGHEIVAPERLAELRPDHVIVMNPIYREEIRSDLDAMGLTPHMHSVGGNND